MVRRHYAQLTLGQLVLFGIVREPEELMDPVLRKIDAVLEDESLVEHVLAALRARRTHSAHRGRPGTPAEVVLRLLVLKHLRGWSYDQLEWEVTGNVVYRRFCRIDARKVPDAKTMVRLGKLIEGPILRALFDRIVAVAIERGVTQGRKMRIDTTVVEAPIHHPTDSRLCEDVVRVLGRALRALAKAGVRLRTRLRDVSLSVARRAREISQAARLRGERARKAVREPYRKLLRITARLVRHADQAVQSARPQLAHLAGRAKTAAATTLKLLATMLPRARQIVHQTRARVLRGQTRTRGKLVSIFETYAQILRRGKPHKPTEFGMLAKVQEAEGGIVTDADLAPDKDDHGLLVPSVERHIQLFGHAPTMAASDRGFYSTEGERRIRDLGVRHPVIPKPGYRSRERIQHERRRVFRRGRAWRAGGEARIARLKHRFGMHRSRYRGESGMRRTVQWAGIANNLVAIGARP